MESINNNNKKFGLAKTPWPRFRANSRASAKSTFPGPKGDSVVWKRKIGLASGEPAIGLNSEIYLPLASKELVMISSKGEELWRQSFMGFSGKSLRGITTPVVRADGSIIAAVFRKVFCLETDGKQRWEKTIDGIPSAPNISSRGTIYVSAWSIDWAGMYVISPKGESSGKDDPRIKKRWNTGRYVNVAAAAIDNKGRVYVPYRDNITHPEAYTWDPIDEVEEEYQYETIIFDSEGSKLGKYNAYISKVSSVYPTTISINKQGLVHYSHGGYPGLVSFSFDDPLPGKNRYRKKKKWTWDLYRDKDNDKEGPAYSHNAYGYVALDKNRVWFRTSKNLSSTRIIVQINTSKVETKKTISWNIFDVSSTAEADPIIDNNGLVYIGTTNGKIHVFSSNGEKIRVIDIKHPISTMIIGPDASLVTTTQDGYICLVQ